MSHEDEGATSTAVDSEPSPEGSSTVPSGARLAWWFHRLPIAAWVVLFVKYRKGGDSIVEQHDVLDFSVAVFHRMTLSDLFSSPNSTVPYLLGGLDRGFVGSEFNLGHVTMVALPVMAGLLVNELAIRTIAFYGMRRFLKSIGLADQPWILFGGATVFSLIPFYVPAFGSVAGIPLLLSAFIGIYDARRLVRADVIIFAAYPLYAAAYATLPIFLLLLCAAVLARRFSSASFAPLGKGLGIHLAAILVVDWRLFLTSATGPVSHRTEMIRERGFDRTIWDGAGASLMREASHAASGRTLVMGTVLLVGAGVLVSSSDAANRRQRRAVLCLTGALVSATVITRLWPWFESSVVSAVLSDWSRFQFSRVQWIEPAVLVALFTIACAVTARAARQHRRITPSVLAVVGVVVFGAQAWALVASEVFVTKPESLSVREYYAPDTMGAVREAIEIDGGDLSVSVGMHPAVAIFNGIDSADGYWTSYPLQYKREFRKLIAPAIDGYPLDAVYYDDWGSRVYPFQGPRGRQVCCTQPRHDAFDVVFEPEAYDDLRITHVISPAPFANAGDVDLELVGDFGRDDELGSIYLYRVV